MKEQRNVRAILFDLDETLLDRTGALRLLLADQYYRFRPQLGRVERRAWISRFLALDQKGMVDKAIVYPRLLNFFGGEPSAAEMLLLDYHQHLCLHAKGFAGMTGTLSQLRQSGLKLGIVTNGGTAMQRRNIEALGLPGLVDVILISEEEGVRKPDRAIFLRASQRLGVESQDCLFVGDNPVSDIGGAAGAGMQTVWFSRKKWPNKGRPPPGVIIRHLNELLLLAPTIPAATDASSPRQLV